MSESLFEEKPSVPEPEGGPVYSPLAARLAPKDLADFSGQEHILGPGKLLRRAIESDNLKSAVFFGPPGAGKTALARYIASRANAKSFDLNAVMAGVADLKKIIEFSRSLGSGLARNQRVLLVLDEIHHFNRTQQDVLLPSVEKGEIILIGMTTENPFFYINQALLSRFIVVEFKQLGTEHLSTIFDRALTSEAGLKNLNPGVTPEAKRYLVENSSGDARRLLNALELAVVTTTPGADGRRLIDEEVARESIQRRSLRYDRSSDEHYDHISAFIKSMRGSDPDAAVYWLARMLEAGEDPRFVARRILICASEDVGNANPMALVISQSAFNSAQVLGMPEARIILAQAAIYVACSPKSNAAYMAVNEAQAEVNTGIERAVPMHLRDASKDGKTLGHGKGYKYPHDFEGHYVKQEYMPDPRTFYRPTGQGFEIEISKRLKRLRGEK
ncbi:MAG: replication-associated recombination protein RarA [Elusimicrobia bacterium CG_4_10_14_0_2_um_filter_56_8]|nr:MAG: AAA family ATPase [Elusimicrobia bacterium CG1_02_56_21]PJA13453.1 MAG: replication-associated recombination protein RarA [Elusimicrobia bacterium CG_4_10_14_0_2_um_filter_56_8]